MTSEEITKGFDEIRQLLRQTAEESKQRSEEADRRSQEADRRSEEADRRSQEVDQRLQKMAQEADRRSEEADRRSEEADRRSQKIDRMFQETAQQFQELKVSMQETDRRMRETDRRIRELTNLFTGQWGKLVEALIEPGCLKLFQDRGINVTKSKRHVGSSQNGRHMEIDILLRNKDDKIVIVVEVKTTLQVSDVRDFLGKFDTFLDFFPKYKGYTIYGAVAGVQIDEGVSEFAYRRGLFVLGLGRAGLVRMLNDNKFEPRVFNR